jgi:hypothetical protein
MISPGQKTAEVGRPEAEANFFPLREAESRRTHFTKEKKYSRPIEAYTRATGKYGHLMRDEIDLMPLAVDDRC